MFIDVHINPAFYEPINGDEAREEMRHEVLDVHKNGTAKLEHIFNQMRLAGLDKMCLMARDYTTEADCVPVTNGPPYCEAPSCCNPCYKYLLH